MKRAEFFLAVKKSSEKKVLEEYCWAITQTVRRSYCGRLSSSVCELGFKTDSLLYTCVLDHVYF
jgi:hypothetical protein